MISALTQGKLLAAHIMHATPQNVDDMPTPYWIKCAFVSGVVVAVVCLLVG